MTNTESNNLMSDATFRGRVKVCCIKYANTLLILPSTGEHFASGYTWATQALQSPDVVAQQVQSPTVMDPAVQTAGVDENGKALITDDALQLAVEGVVNKKI